MNRIIVLILILLGFSNPIFGCSCSNLGDFELREVDQYEYVGLVKIKKLIAGDIPASSEDRSSLFHWAEVQELIGYKGNLPERIKIYGGNRNFEYQTSCDLGVQEGDEWVFFAQKFEEELWIMPCVRNTRYKNKDGRRDWQYMEGFKELIILDSAFHGGENDFLEWGKDTLYYLNGQIERVQSLKNGKAHGERKYFFPNGVVYGVETIQNGQLDGPVQWNFINGDPHTLDHYKSGRKVGYSYYWGALDPVNPLMESFYDKKSRITSFKEFYIGRRGRYLSRETQYNYKSGTYTNYYYSEEGQLQEKEVYLMSDHSQLEFVRFEDGN